MAGDDAAAAAPAEAPARDRRASDGRVPGGRGAARYHRTPARAEPSHPPRAVPIADYEQFPEPFAADGMRFPVYHRGAGPGVILMHELPGMGRECVALADRFVDEGFTVFLPLFFGAAGEDAHSGLAIGVTAARVCLMREFRCFAKRESSPVTTWLRALAREVRARCGGPGVGAVGMCFTGGFVLSMMIEPDVVAPVACQPSLPLNPPGPDDGAWRSELGISPQDLADARRRHEAGVPLLGLRFATDEVCPRERMDRMEREFPNMVRLEIPAPEKRHATLTRAFDPTAYAAVAGFLRQHLLAT